MKDVLREEFVDYIFSIAKSTISDSDSDYDEEEKREAELLLKRLETDFEAVKEEFREEFILLFL